MASAGRASFFIHADFTLFIYITVVPFIYVMGAEGKGGGEVRWREEQVGGRGREKGVGKGS